ncbi:NACHT domain-containing protein [Streptomyces sp. ME02-8801-2C]|uniref:NACHT domain-containing protein n=1 Tax=Streptomyces sp. ME02-8801-2C TaxID=3028680 RepID=UPI0029BE68F0|nr:NACHT domain-containing protein [Streptomyces sp. ME02-8801-2C]MDX3454002.1 NACHT domain-containing protein [Streptomyces sp. ME02-8801-2C]
MAVESEQLRRLGEALSPPLAVPSSGGGRASDQTLVELAGRLDELRRKRLVLLGDPGSGKTTTARRLVIDLLWRSGSQPPGTGPVPVMATLSSWNPASERLDDWFTACLADRYGLRQADVRGLIRHRRVLPVIDGLDELPASQGGTAIPFLLHWLTGFDGYVLTCRTSAFLELDGDGPLRSPLHLTASLGPLPTATVTDHLRHADEERWLPVAQAVEEEPHGPLAEALSSPWLLSLAVNGYAGNSHRDPAELTDQARLHDVTSIRQRILSTADPTSSIEGWGTSGRQRLELLTDAMGREADGLLLWWRMADRYGSARVRRILCAVLLGLPALLVMTDDKSLGVQVLLLFTAVGAYVSASHVEDEPLPRRFGHRRIRTISRSAHANVTGWTRTLMFCAYLSVLSLFMIPSVLLRPNNSLISVPGPNIATLTGCALAALVVSVTNQAAEPRHGPRAGQLRNDLWASLARATAGTVLVLLPLRHPGLDIIGIGVELPRPTWVAVVSGLFGTLMIDSAWGRYRLTHLSLAVKGRLPFRLARFLAEAQQQGLLVPADGYGTGCYAFRHDLVRQALVARGTSRLSHVRAAMRIQSEIRDEVLSRPESVSYLAYMSDGAPEAYANESERIMELTDGVLIGELRVVADSGLDPYLRYHSARERLVRAVPVPGWATQRLARFYSALAVVAGVIAYEAALLLIDRNLTFLLLWTMLGGAFSFSVLHLARASAIARARPVRVRDETLLKVPLVWVTAFFFLDPLLLPHHMKTVAVISAALATVSLWAWLHARLYVVRAQAALGDNPNAWPDVPAAHVRLRDAALQTRQDWVTALARDGVMPLIRDRLRVSENAGAAPATPALPAIDSSRLTGSRSSDQFVGTVAADEVALHLGVLKTGSIGVSGQRGAGKSSLMQRFCTPGPMSKADDLLVLVPAPTSYDPREFLIHLFAEVCRKVTGDSPADDGHPGPDLGRRKSLALHAGAVLTTLAGVVLLILTLLRSELTNAARTITEHTHNLLIAGGVLLLVAGVVWELLLPVRAGRRAGIHSSRTRTVALASDQLRTLHYQLTVMRTHTAQLALPAGLQLADGSQVQHTRQILTHPELVARFRTLLHQVAVEQHDLGGRVVIGIDELDKLGSAQEAERFLNDLKAVFGVPGCHFLVAVSEDALTAFGRHTLDVRTTFDSAFDHVVAVGPLGLDHARQLLELRGVWLPEPYLWLCQVLSGGLPRELLRSVTSLATHRALHHTTDMRRLMSTLIEDDARAVLSAQTRYATTLTGTRGPAAAHWIAKASQAPATVGGWEAALIDVPHVDQDEYETAHAVTQVRAFLLLGATLLRTFTEGSDAETSQRVDRVRFAGPEPVDLLTTARTKLATEPGASWAAVARFRTEILNMPPT